jgi:hypothetical protein
MGKVIPMLGGGGGADLDMITATAPDVRAGKVIVDKEGNPLTGTEPERGNWTGSVAMNGKVAIPDGHHGGGGYVNGPVVTQRGAWNGAVGMNTQVAIPEGYHNGAGKVTGPSVAFQNADVAGTDRANATNRSCWDGTICLGVRNNHYLNGVNWIQFSDPNFRASNFKKGVPIMGLIGTFEGYVPTPTDLYLRGNNPAGFKSNGNTIIDSGQITLKSDNASYATSTANAVNLTGFSYLNVEFYKTNGKAGFIDFSAGESNARNEIVRGGGFTGTTSFNLSGLQLATRISLAFGYIGSTSSYGAVYRIWLS